MLSQLVTVMSWRWMMLLLMIDDYESGWAGILLVSKSWSAPPLWSVRGQQAMSCRRYCVFVLLWYHLEYSRKILFAYAGGFDRLNCLGVRCRDVGAETLELCIIAMIFRDACCFVLGLLTFFTFLCLWWLFCSFRLYGSQKQRKCERRAWWYRPAVHRRTSKHCNVSSSLVRVCNNPFHCIAAPLTP